MKRYFITAKHDSSLLELLTAHLPSPHKPDVVIFSGGVWRGNKRLLDPNMPIRATETVTVRTSPFQGKIYHLDPEQVVFETHDLLVVYKPPDLNVHAVPTSLQYHLSYGVTGYLEREGIQFEATPLTRLDRPVEGLVLFAKNKPAERKLFELIQRRLIKKWYTAALEKPDGVRHPRCLRVRDKIASNGSRTLLHPGGKFADSLFIKTHSIGNADIYSVFIFTGRRHQIRFHASHYLAPIIGDGFYGSTVALPPDQIALMCRGYNIPFRRKRYRVRIPEKYLEKFLENLP